MFFDPQPQRAPDGSAAMSAAVAGGPVEVDLEALNHTELTDRVEDLVQQRSRVEGAYLAALGELTKRNGTQSAAYQLREYTRMSSSQARSESRLAESLRGHEMTATLDALAAGEIQMSHARVIAREAPKKHRRSEPEFLELSQAYPCDVIARYPFAYESLEVFADLQADAAATELSPIDAEHALQRSQRRASMRMGADGMWHLRATFDAVTGRHINGILQAEVRSQRHRNNNAVDNTAGNAGGR